VGPLILDLSILDLDEDDLDLEGEDVTAELDFFLEDDLPSFRETTFLYNTLASDSSTKTIPIMHLSPANVWKNGLSIQYSIPPYTSCSHVTPLVPSTSTIFNTYVFRVLSLVKASAPCKPV
jgi:hypothetical protein